MSDGVTMGVCCVASATVLTFGSIYPRPKSELLHRQSQRLGCDLRTSGAKSGYASNMFATVHIAEPGAMPERQYRG